jgi:hypothetical protein
MDRQGWWLTDAEESQRNYPYSFYKPSAAVLAQLTVGQQVKLIFEFDNPDPEGMSGERMWVTIGQIEGDRFKGVLDNEPTELKALKFGDPVDFEARHIIQTKIDEVEPDKVEKYLPRCFVTHKVLFDGVKAGYVYRQEPQEDSDSGWRITAGDESDAYMDDDDNIYYVSLGKVLNQDDSFLHLLDAEVGSAFERNEATGEFEALE